MVRLKTIDPKSHIIIIIIIIITPLYTDTRYNDRIRYNDNLIVMKPLVKG